MKNYIRLFHYIRPYWTVIVITWVLSVFVLISQTLTVWVGAGFLQYIIIGHGESVISNEVGLSLYSIMDVAASKILYQEDQFTSILYGAIVLFGTGFLTGALRLVKLYILGRVNQSVLARIRMELFSEIIKRDIVFTKRNNPGVISSLFIQDVDQLNNALLDAVDRLFMQPLRLLFVIYLMFSISGELTVYVMLFILAGGVVTYVIGRKIEKVWRSFFEKIAHAQGYLTEFFSTALLSRSFGRDEFEKKAFSGICSEIKDLRTRQIIAQTFSPEIVKVLLVFSGAVIFILGGYRVFVTGTLNGQELLKMVMLLPLATYPMEALASLYTSVKTSMASAGRVFSFLDDRSCGVRRSGNMIIRKFRTAVKLHNVSFSVSGRKILDNVNLVINKGETVSISGKSGSGKTTLLSVIAGFVQPSSGDVSVDGIKLDDVCETSWIGRLGIITQEPVLLNKTIRENMLYAKPDATDFQLKSVLKSARVWDDIEAFPSGLDTIVGNRGDFVSGGEKQRITIARALLLSPEIIIMDEPTSMLDKKSRDSIMETIRGLSGKYTVVIVTHDESLAALATRRYSMMSGKLKQINRQQKKCL